MWENDVLSSASDEVIQEGHHALAQHPTRLVHSTFELAECPNMLSGSEETSGTNTDDSSLKYLTERRCGSSGNRSGCSSPGYFPQVKPHEKEYCCLNALDSFLFAALLLHDSFTWKLKYWIQPGLSRLGSGEPPSWRRTRLAFALDAKSFQLRRTSGRIVICLRPY